MWRKLVAAGCAALMSFNLFFMILAAAAGMAYEMRNKGLWLTCVALALLAMLLTGRGGGFRLALLPLLCPATFVLFIGGLDMGVFEHIMIAVNLGLAAALLARAEAEAMTKEIIGWLSGLLVLPVLLFLGISLIWGLSDGFTDYAVNRSFPSPGGAYRLDVRIVDEGALGGSTYFTLYPSDSPVDLPFGTLGRPLAEMHKGWIDPDELKVSWRDTETPIINGHLWRWQKEG